MPDWEVTLGFDPLAAVETFSQREVGWKFLPGTGFTATVLDDNLHDLVTNPIFPQMSTPLRVRDPDTFVVGVVHKYGEVWDQLTRDIPNRAEVMGWITNRVSVRDYVQHFKGSFGGIDYDSREPMPTIFNNSHSCASFAEFISRTISERIEVGAVSVLGRVGECSPPIIVMPLTVEPNKPRLCQDQRYLNCWMKDMPFRLDSVVNLTRYVGQGHFQAKLDDKSGYDHVLMANDSRLWMGFQWGGWWFLNNVLPFGWKISPYIYQSLGMVATQELRKRQIPCSQYIDDRHLGQRRQLRTKFLDNSEQLSTSPVPSSFERASQSVSVAVYILTALGYFLNLSKSVLIPVQKLIFLGLSCDSLLTAFLLPREKIEKFATLRERILSQRSVTIVCLQKLVGKCVSFSLVVPAAKLFTREMCIALSNAQRTKRFVRILRPLRDEIQFWRFLDSWEGHMPWHDERNLVVSVASDASAFAWGGVLLGDGGALLQEFGDAWCEPILSQPIHVKETVALSRTLLALSETVRNHRVDVCVDSRPLLDCWERQYTRSHDMLEALKELFWITVRLNVALSLKYVPSSVNPADIPSRRLSVLDCSLSRRLWLIVQRTFGGPSGHTCDLMALDSNAQCDLHGYPLPHFAPVLTPNAMGVNVFAQSITSAGSSIFPVVMFSLLLPLFLPFCDFCKNNGQTVLL